MEKSSTSEDLIYYASQNPDAFHDALGSSSSSDEGPPPQNPSSAPEINKLIDENVKAVGANLQKTLDALKNIIDDNLTTSYHYTRDRIYNPLNSVSLSASQLASNYNLMRDIEMQDLRTPLVGRPLNAMFNARHPPPTGFEEEYDYPPPSNHRDDPSSSRCAGPLQLIGFISAIIIITAILSIIVVHFS